MGFVLVWQPVLDVQSSMLAEHKEERDYQRKFLA